MKCVVALVIYAANILSCYGNREYGNREYYYNSNRTPKMAQPQWYGDYPTARMSCDQNTDLYSSFTPYMEFLRQMSADSRQLRDEDAVMEEQPLKTPRPKSKPLSGSRMKPRPLRPVEESNEDYSGQYVTYKTNVKSPALYESVNVKRSQVPKVTRAAADYQGPKTEATGFPNPSPEDVKSVKQIQEQRSYPDDEIVHAYHLLQQILRDPLFGLLYDPMLRMMPNNPAAISALSKDITSSAKVTRDNSHDKDNTKLPTEIATKEEKSNLEQDYNVKTSKVFPRSAPIFLDEFFENPALSAVENEYLNDLLNIENLRSIKDKSN